MAVGHGGQILVSSATERLVSGVELRDLGEHRLRDLSTPERVFQLLAILRCRDFPPLRSLDAFATNLPVQTTASWVAIRRSGTLLNCRGAPSGHADRGRRRREDAAGVSGGRRGAAGISDDGVFLIELGGVIDATAIDETVAAASLDTAAARANHRRQPPVVLGQQAPALVFDNCEHLLEPVAHLVTRILGVAPTYGSSQPAGNRYASTGNRS